MARLLWQHAGRERLFSRVLVSLGNLRHDFVRHHVAEPRSRHSRLDGGHTGRQGFANMKTISVQEVARDFDEYARQAHEGERILVTRKDEPWVLLAPPTAERHTPRPRPLAWPDFAGRLKPYYAEVVPGPTATELLAQDKDDRF